jgi:hypothetical protein
MGSRHVDQTTPFAQRWGGWYVTGTHGNEKHLGNLILHKEVQPTDIDNTGGQNVTDLTGRFSTSAYLTPHSDIVALMVLEHQTEMHNRITQLNFQTRMALWQEAALKKAFGESGDTHLDSTLRRIASAGDDLVELMLFCDEAPLTGAVAGTSSFQAEFQQRGPGDHRGRSLRDFDLATRLFKYPCSYLIHSAAFDALPELGRDYVLRRLWEILTSTETDTKFAHLSQADRQSILEILRDTKENLPDYWKTGTPPAGGEE